MCNVVIWSLDMDLERFSVEVFAGMGEPTLLYLLRVFY